MPMRTSARLRRCPMIGAPDGNRKMATDFISPRRMGRRRSRCQALNIDGTVEEAMHSREQPMEAETITYKLRRGRALVLSGFKRRSHLLPQVIALLPRSNLEQSVHRISSGAQDRIRCAGDACRGSSRLAEAHESRIASQASPQTTHKHPLSFRGEASAEGRWLRTRNP